MVHREGYWYAVAQDHLRGRMRLFRLDGVLEAEVLGETFVRPPGFDAPQQVLDTLAAMQGDRWSVEVLLLEATLEEAREQVPPMGVALERAAGGVLMRSSTSDLGRMARVGGLEFPVCGAPATRATRGAQATRRGDRRSGRAYRRSSLERVRHDP